MNPVIFQKRVGGLTVCLLLTINSGLWYSGHEFGSGYCGSTSWTGTGCNSWPDRRSALRGALGDLESALDNHAKCTAVKAALGDFRDAGKLVAALGKQLLPPSEGPTLIQQFGGKKS